MDVADTQTPEFESAYTSTSCPEPNRKSIESALANDPHARHVSCSEGALVLCIDPNISRYLFCCCGNSISFATRVLGWVWGKLKSGALDRGMCWDLS